MTSPSSSSAAHLTPALPPAYPDRAAWGTATKLRAWQTEALTQYFDDPAARLPRRRHPRRRQDDVRADGGRRAALAAADRARHDRGAHRAPQDPVGRGGGEGRHRRRPVVRRRQGPHQQGVRRRRGDLRGRRGQPAGAADPHRAGQDAGDPRRDPPRRRRAVVGRVGARGLRAGPPAPRADRHAVPLRRQPDPVRGLRPRRRRGAAQRGRLQLRLLPGAGRPRRAPRAVPGLLRRHAVAHPRRRRGGRPAGRAADQGPVGAGAAHGARPARLVDGLGAGRGRPPPRRGAPTRARRGRAGDRQRPGVGPLLRPAAGRADRGEAGRGAVGREGGVEEDRGLHRLRRPLDGRGPAWSPRASTCRGWRSASTPP